MTESRSWVSPFSDMLTAKTDNKVYPELYAGQVVVASPCPQHEVIQLHQPQVYPPDTPQGVVATAYPPIQPSSNVNAQARVITQQPLPSDRWRSSPFDCCVDGGGVCCLVCCCPCVPIGYHADLVGWNCCLTATLFTILYSPSWVMMLLIGCPAPPLSCLIHWPLRRKLRVRYGVIENCSGEDCLCTLFCPLCSICQEVHEVRAHGETRV